jgi:hypothetical protein
VILTNIIPYITPYDMIELRMVDTFLNRILDDMSINKILKQNVESHLEDRYDECISQFYNILENNDCYLYLEDPNVYIVPADKIYVPDIAFKYKSPKELRGSINKLRKELKALISKLGTYSYTFKDRVEDTPVYFRMKTESGSGGLLIINIVKHIKLSKTYVRPVYRLD